MAVAATNHNHKAIFFGRERDLEMMTLYNQNNINGLQPHFLPLTPHF